MGPGGRRVFPWIMWSDKETPLYEEAPDFRLARVRERHQASTCIRRHQAFAPPRGIVWILGASIGGTWSTVSRDDTGGPFLAYYRYILAASIIFIVI